MPDIQIGDLVKYRNDRSWASPPIKGVWLVIDVKRDTDLVGEVEGKYATLKKGSDTRYTHISHLKKV